MMGIGAIAGEPKPLDSHHRPQLTRWNFSKVSSQLVLLSKIPTKLIFEEFRHHRPQFTYWKFSKVSSLLNLIWKITTELTFENSHHHPQPTYTGIWQQQGQPPFIAKGHIPEWDRAPQSVTTVKFPKNVSSRLFCYGVVTLSRLLKITGLFCKRAL